MAKVYGTVIWTNKGGFWQEIMASAVSVDEARKLFDDYINGENKATEQFEYDEAVRADTDGKKLDRADYVYGYAVVQEMDEGDFSSDGVEVVRSGHNG